MIAEASIFRSIDYLDNESTKIAISHAMITTALELGVKANEWLVICLIESMNNEGITVPSVEKIGEIVDLSERQAYQIIKNLRQKGFLSTQRGNTSAKTTEYDFSPLKRQIKLKQLGSKSNHSIFRSALDSVKQ